MGGAPVFGLRLALLHCPDSLGSGHKTPMAVFLAVCLPLRITAVFLWCAYYVSVFLQTMNLRGWPNKPAAAKAEIAFRLTFKAQSLGLPEPGRWAGSHYER